MASSFVSKIIANDPHGCRLALVGASDPYVVVDVETTGIKSGLRLVSVGVLVDKCAHILFVGSLHASVSNRSLEVLRFALEPLAVPNDLVVLGYNFTFDLGHLARVGVHIVSSIHDSMQQLRILDPDRGPDGSEVRTKRRDLRAPAGANPFLNYRLKDAVPQISGLAMVHFPGRMEDLPFAAHVKYLTSDLIGTRALHDVLWSRIAASPKLLIYHDQVAAPLTPLLASLTELGVQGDSAFIQAEAARLEQLAEATSDAHRAAFGVPLDGGDKFLRPWIFNRLGIRPLPGKLCREAGRWVPSLDFDHLAGLRERHKNNPRVVASLSLISDYRKADSLHSKLTALIKHVALDGRIHSCFVDRQASGRVSSSSPNLQQLANATTIAGQQFYLRNAVVATSGYELIAVDLAQADVRILAHAMESFPRRGSKHLKLLRKRHRKRLALLDPNFAILYAKRSAYRNPHYPLKPKIDELDFDPKLATGLADDFRRAEGDFYSVAAQSMLGKPPADKEERDRCKRTILGVLNGMGVGALAKRVGGEQAARTALKAFDHAYPQFAPYRRMLEGQIALTGCVKTFMGRPRIDSAQRWIATRPRVKMLVSYRNSDAYWVLVTPLEPRRHVLCCYIHRAWDARPGPTRGHLIYHAVHGKLSGLPYRLYDQFGLEFLLPYRNFSWRSIRRVRTSSEEAVYRGFDATCRSLINTIFQGGTADLARILMLRSPAACAPFGARLLWQIHDELVYEVPTGVTDTFIRMLDRELSRPPCPGFRVPVVIEVKRGFAFGSLRKVSSSVVHLDMRGIASLRRPRLFAAVRPGRCPWPPVWPAGEHI